MMVKITTIRLLLPVFLLTLFFNNAITENASESECVNQLKPVTKIISSLCSQLIKEIKGEDNFFFSPLSISAALAMIYTGAEGTTKKQMTDALHYNLAGKSCLDYKINEEFGNLFTSLTNQDTYTLLIANSVFIHLGLPVSPKYLSKLRNYFKTYVEYLDFVNEETLSLEAINNWVANQTKGHIKKLLNEPLDRMTMMILMNVIYFKGLWKHPFAEEKTWNSSFYKKDGTKKTVPFMQLEQILKYYHDEETNYSFLELDYMGGNISMLLIMAKSYDEFPDIELTSEALCDIRSQLQSTNVMAVVPKFKLEYRRELSKDMTKLGMDELFSDRADLTGIREQNDIHVSLMIHKAVLEVDEKGSEASAVTGVGIDARRRPERQRIFWANHPFLFYIIDKESNTIIFAGRLSDP
ncbi:serine protease inhibitor 2.1-like [Argiope bruennichi]|uniref:Serpin B10 like protein n=1 Tax=Argiope bruennichi TaxID=94029 RepID=A0A8T0FHB8_ARGBR|nr:serine protease inhibitor 2.1-like [Argiope bruennichi]KAF8788869.1 Serpin B10 like protein [Argiope bruennichi]